MSSGSDEATRPTVARGEALFFCLSIRFRDAPRNRKSKKRIACRVHRRASWEHARECGTFDSVLRYACCSSQHLEPRRNTECGSDVLCLVAGLELYARLGGQKPDRPELVTRKGVCAQPSLDGTGRGRQSFGATDGSQSGPVSQAGDGLSL